MTDPKDFEGNSYQNIQIGEQIWLTQNLNTSKFINGDEINEAKTIDEWVRAGSNKSPAWCYYNSDPNNGPIYGKLYNWFAFSDPRGFLNPNWRIPDEKDWEILTNFINGKDPSLRITFFENWLNSTGVKYENTIGGLGGFRHRAPNRMNDKGEFFGLNEDGHWFSNSKLEDTENWEGHPDVWTRYVHKNKLELTRPHSDMRDGCSIILVSYTKY